MKYNGDEEFHDPSDGYVYVNCGNVPVDEAIDTMRAFYANAFGTTSLSSYMSPNVDRSHDVSTSETVRALIDTHTAPKSSKQADDSRRKSDPHEKLADRLHRERDELALAVAVLTEKLTRREHQLTRLARYPVDDPCVDGAILRFEKRFPRSEQRYTYVAARINGRWFTTGKRSPQGITWGELVEFMGLGVDEVWHVNATRPTHDGGVRQEEQMIIG